MKILDVLHTYKVPIGFAIVALFATVISIGLFWGVLSPKSYSLKLYGGILTGAATILFVLITFVFDKGSSKKSDDILGNTTETRRNVETIDRKADTSIEKLSSLQIENIKLRDQIIALQNEQMQKNKEVLELGERNLEQLSTILKLNETIQNLNTGGTSFPDLGHCNTALYGKGVQTFGYRLQLSFEIFNAGEYPLDNVKIRGYQVSDFRNTHPATLWTEVSMSGLNIHSRYANVAREFQEFINKIDQQGSPIISSNYDVLKSGQREIIGPIGFKESFQYYGINIFVESKRQDWIILLRLYRSIVTDTFTYQAYKIMKITAQGLENVKEVIDSGFPIGADNKFIWFNSELPKEWFSSSKSKTSK